MLFNSINFLIFFPVVTLIYFIIPDRIKYLWLLVCSYFFYMNWNAEYAILIFISTFITYISGLLIENNKKTTDRRAVRYRKYIVALSFLLNLGILFYFKYSNFAFDSLQKIFACFNVELKLPAVDVLLPVGISFYTFQALSYTMDVYRGDIYAERNFFRYALFVSFFPQLVAGPIERSKNLLRQLAVPRRFTFDNFRNGIILMLYGYFLKLVLADRIAVFVDMIYGNHEKYTGWYLIAASILFAVQIYCDFAGYSIIALGSAKILGIELMENFDAPYLSTSVSDFWRRWHISLTSWFKDYLYIPLGGSRRGKIRKYLNKMIVFLVSGLWHGSKVSYIVWGGLNGLYQVIGEMLMPLRTALTDRMHINRQNRFFMFIQGIITFLLIDFAFVFFRADGFKDALFVCRSIFSADNFSVITNGSIMDCGLGRANFILMLFAILVLIFADILKRKGISFGKWICGCIYPVRALFFIFAVMFILIFGVYGPAYSASSFIYFQF